MKLWTVRDFKTVKILGTVTGTKAQAAAVARKIATSKRCKLTIESGRQNPGTPDPVAGERWTRKYGGSAASVTDYARPMVYFTSGGDRGSMIVEDFKAKFRPPAGRLPNARRRNPIGPPAAHESRVGRRVQLHAATSEWMQGDRYGVIVGYGRARDYLDRSTGEITKARPVKVKLDKSGRVRVFHPENLFEIESNPGGPRIVYNRLLGGWYVVTGPHQTPLNGLFNSKAEAQAWLDGGPARRGQNPRPGKMRVEDYNALRAAIEAQLAKWPANAHSQYEAAGLSPRRFRWDVLHASKFPIMPLYAYLNDANVDTALRSILGHGPERETSRKANPKGRKPAPRKETFRETEARYEDWISRAAENWASIANRRAMSGIFGSLYLYVRPSTATQDGALYWLTEDEKPDPLWQLATAEGFGSNLTQAQVRAKVWDVARRLPLYAYGSVSNPRAIVPCGQRRHNPGCPCDPRCCGATGDVCECRCGGAYHKSGGGGNIHLTHRNPAGPISGGLFQLRDGSIVLAHAQDPNSAAHWLIQSQAEKYLHSGKVNEREFVLYKPYGGRMIYLQYVGPRIWGGKMQNPRAAKWRVIDAAGRQFWQGEATDEGEALFMAERSAAGQADPPDPWMALQGNPSYRLTGTVEEIPDAPPVARRGPGRPRKVRLAPLDLAPPADAVPFEVPGEAVQGGDLQPGDRVSVPYSGRASYFGRTAKHTRESGIFEGYTYENDQRLAFVRVIRGHSVETHAFPVDQVRIHGKSFAAQAAGRRAGRPAKLARLTWKAHGSLAKAEAMLEKATAEHAATEALAMELYPQHEAQPGRPRGRTTPASREYANARAKLRRLTERVELLGSVVRSLGGGQEYGQATGTDPWAANRRRIPNPTRPIHGALKAPRTVRGASRKRNPRGSERQRAVKTFRMWHEFAPHRITKMKGPDRLIPRTLVKLGDIRSIDYISDKYEGRPVTYTHKTDRPRPVLATDPDGQNLHIIGGRVKITGDGLIH